MDVKVLLKSTLQAAGLTPSAKRSLLEMRLLGERVKFLVQPRPQPGEAILLAGAGRSGTTWLAEVLASVAGVQQIFEPLLFNPHVYQLTNWPPPPVETYLRLYYLRPGGSYPGWHALLERILTGRYRTYLTDSHRTSLFSGRYLIKEIRANLMLGYIYDHFQPTIIYMKRHPCAVVASRMRLNWRVDLDELLRQEELVADYLSHWVGDIERARHNPLEAHAIWCAVESMVAEQDLATRKHYLLHYEHLVLDPEQRLKALLSWLGLKGVGAIPQHVIERESRTTWNDSIKAEPSEHRHHQERWKQSLSRSEQFLILEWSHRLGVRDYRDGVLPVANEAAPR